MQFTLQLSCAIGTQDKVCKLYMDKNSLHSTQEDPAVPQAIEIFELNLNRNFCL